VLPTNGDFIQRHAEAVCLQHKVTVLHIVSDNTLSETKIDIKEINNVQTLIGYVKPTKNPILKSFRFFKTYFQLLKKTVPFDILHLNVLFPFGIFALHQKWIHKVPYIISEHWTGYNKFSKKQISFFEKSLSKIITKNAFTLCPVSEQLSLSMQNTGLKGNYIPIGNVVDTQLFKPGYWKENTFTIIHISGLNNLQKNISGMLKTAKKLEEHIGKFTWKFIGGNETQYQNLLSDLAFTSAKIEFIPHLTQTELATHIQTAHICVSFSNYETFGITMIEAIASGTFVVATNTGILTEFTKDNFFKSIPINDESALVEAIVNRLNQPEKLNTDKMHNLIDTKFSKEVISKQFTKIYHQALKPQP
jgi:glycosyltransferase involved in cell wall biosynthesis